jgi:hypothetical protein
MLNISAIAAVALSPMVATAASIISGLVACFGVVMFQANSRKEQSRLQVEETRLKVAPYLELFAAISEGRLRFTNGGQWYYTNKEGHLVVADFGARGSESFDVYDASDPWAQNYLRNNPPRPPDPALATSVSRTFQLFERLTEAY